MNAGLIVIITINKITQTNKYSYNLSSVNSFRLTLNKTINKYYTIIV